NRRCRSKKKGVKEVDGDEDVPIFNDSSDADSVKERSGKYLKSDKKDDKNKSGYKTNWKFDQKGESKGDGSSFKGTVYSHCKANGHNSDRFLNTIVRCMAHYNLFDNLQSSGDDSNTVDTGNNSSSNTSSKKKRGLVRGSKPLPNGKKKNIRECYDISHVSWFDLKEKIRDAWKRYKYRLNTTLIVGNNPRDVKAFPDPEFVPREDWVKFVDYCNSKKFMAKSKMNKENRVKLIAPCTLGRTSMPITRHKLAEKKGVTDEEIGRVEVYIPAHTKKDKIIQCPEVIKFCKERKGGTRGMGAGMSISMVEKVGYIVNENEELRSNNNELKFAIEKLRKDLDALTKYVGNILVISLTDNLPSQQATSSSQREQEKHQHIDKECRLVGCPWRIVAHGVIVGVDPTDMCHSVALGDDFYKVAIHDIVDVVKALHSRFQARVKEEGKMLDIFPKLLRPTTELYFIGVTYGRETLKLTEVSASDKLENFRASQELRRKGSRHNNNNKSLSSNSSPSLQRLFRCQNKIEDINNDVETTNTQQSVSITLDNVNPVGLGRKSRQIFDQVWRNFSGLGQISRTNTDDTLEFPMITAKCLLHWKSFEAERTSVFDRLIQMIGSAIEAPRTSRGSGLRTSWRPFGTNSPNSHWQSIIETLNNLLATLKQNFVCDSLPY
ncbi:hypothetical protein GIB67_005359, partial [Kingdonia uniflora]